MSTRITAASIYVGMTMLPGALETVAQGVELPEVAGLLVRVEVIDDHLGLRRIVELVLDAVIARDAAALGDEQRALMEDNPVRCIEVLEQYLRLALAALVDDRVHLVQLPRADEQRAFVALRHRARAGHAFGPHLDLEARGNLELAYRQVLRRLAGHLDRERVQRRFGHRGRLALLPRGRGRRGGLVLRLSDGENAENGGSECGSHRSSPVGLRRY